MTPYPSAEERAQIIARRKQLRQELIPLLVSGDPRQTQKPMQRLIRRYGQAEVERMLNSLQRTLSRDTTNETLWMYREYMDYYRRFGGQRPWLNLEVFTTAQDEFSDLYARQRLGQTLSSAESQRLAELTDLLFKEAPLWEDLTPEDPPAEVPAVELPLASPKSTGLPQAAPSATPYRHRCSRDGFPILTLKGRSECVAEYLDRHIGQQPVSDVIQRGKTTYYVFENGYELPMLCSCCDGPLMYQDIEATRQDMRGRRLEAMSIQTQVLEDGREVEEFVLEFSKKGWFSQGVALPVSFSVATQLRRTVSPGRPIRPASAKKKKRSHKR
jgi:hypothetical protein